MDLRDVEHSSNTRIKLAKATKQLRNINVLWAINFREFPKDIFEVISFSGAGWIGKHDPVRQVRPQHSFKLVVVCVVAVIGPGRPLISKS
jgi:hypothetical protein